MTDVQHKPVVIVGGGPVGLGLAIDLGQRGVRTVLVERHAAMHRVPKGQNLTQRTLEHFHFWGAETALRAARTIPPDYGIGGLTAYGSLLGDYSYDWMQRDLVKDYYYTANERLPQYATETVLRRRLAELDIVQTLYGWAAQGIAQDGEGATVAVANRETGEARTLDAAYVVGCDGSRSLVREAAAITQTVSDHDKRMVLLVFRSPQLHDLLRRFPGKSYYSVLHPNLKGYWQFFGRVDLGSSWFFHAPVPMDTTADNFDFKAYARAAVGADFDMEIDYVGFWDLRFAVADTYRNGRLFIAGDAAHAHPPYGGYGINTGLEDAANLGWKLAAMLQGWGGDGLLDSYGEERQPVFVSTARDFIEKAIHTDRDFLAAFDPGKDRAAFEQAWQARQQGAPSEVNAFVPNYEGSSLVWSAPGAPSALGTHQFTARAGHHLAPQALSCGRNVYEALGKGFTLLALDGQPQATAAFGAAAQRLGVPLTVLEDSRAGGRERYGAALVLIRPDQFVAWTGDDAPADAQSILAKAVGRTTEAIPGKG